jgi:CID domain
MADELRGKLRLIDVTQPAIQGAANAMMKYYDRSPMTAVTEWRNALPAVQSSTEQLLALLYVANEVVQTSRRNRGKKFVDLFTPVLGPSLVYMAQQGGVDLTEKIRRVVKIWGDRRVFHMKDINDWMAALESYRERRPSLSNSVQHGASFSPLVEPGGGNETEPVSTTTAPLAAANAPTPLDDNADIMNILDAHSARKSQSDGESDDNAQNDDDIFGDDSERQTLEIDVSVDAVAALASANQLTPTASRPVQKRRRSSGTTGANGKKVKVLSISNLLAICNQLAENQQKFELAQLALQRISQNIAAVSDDELSNLVGDALQDAVKQNEADLRNMMSQKRLLHHLANERRTLGLEATRYLPWLEAALVQDQDDIAFTVTLQEKISQFLPIHVELKKTRDKVREEERRTAAIEAEQERRRKEAEEAERFRQEAMSRQNEEKPGMVWNPSTREYQALNTDESWRD